MTPGATLNGVGVLGAHGPQGWSLTAGTAPHARVLVMDRGEAEKVLAVGQPGGCTLQIDVAGAPSLRVEKLTVLSMGPALHPLHATVTVVDRRWFWERRHVAGSFNIRRRTGERRRITPDAPVAIQQLADDVAFAPWSINGTTRWKASEVLERVMTDLLQGEPFKIKGPVPTLSVEDLVVDDQGDSALMRVLGYFGGVLDVFMDLDGTAIVFNRADGSERGLVGLGGGTRIRGTSDAGPPSAVGPPLWQLSDRSRERPKLVKVLFSRLVEFRADGADTGSTSDATTDRGDLPLTIENVLPSTDRELDIPALNGRPARTVLEGTWITVEEALAAWTAIGWPIRQTLDLTAVRETYLLGLNLAWAPPKDDPEDVYRRRLAALSSNFRQTYRLVRRWRDRMGELLPRRTELRDAETGAVATSPLFCDFATKLNRKGIEKAMSENPENVALFVNHYAAGEGVSVKATAVTGMKASPARVQILDQDQGVMKFLFSEDPRLEVEAFFCAFTPERVPGLDPSGHNILTSNGWLAASHEVSVILSTVAVAPNDTRRFHQELVFPIEAQKALGVELGKCEGPIATLRVPTNNLRSLARFSWDDARAAQFRQAFAFRDKPPATPFAVQDAFGDPLNGYELVELAKSVAARFYARLRDHILGQLTTGWSPGIKPTGAAAPVVHTLAEDGTALTTIDFLEDLPALDEFGLLPEAVRKTVLGEVMT